MTHASSLDKLQSVLRTRPLIIDNATSLTVADLDVTLNGAHIVQAASFRVSDGRSVAILGPNGAGKTTLVRALMGLGAGVASGRIAIGAQELLDRPA